MLLPKNASKDEWDTPVSPRRMRCMPKGTSWAEAMSDSEKIKYIPLAIVKF